MTFPDYALFVLLLLTGSMGMWAVFRPDRSRLFWICAMIDVLCLATVLALFAAGYQG